MKEQILHRLKHIESIPVEMFGFDVIDAYELNDMPLYLRKDSMDETLTENILFDCCYNPNMWFNRNLREEFYFGNVSNIFDIGANIGIASRYFNLIFPNANIYSIEPDDDNFKLLIKNSRMIENIHPIQAAIWKNNNGVYITNRENVIGHSGRVNPAKYMVGEVRKINEHLVKSLTIQNLMERYKISQIDILKIDVQGAEIEIFESASEWLDKVRLIFIELHDLFRDNCSNVVLKKIADNGNFKFIGSPNGELLAFIKGEELL